MLYWGFQYSDQWRPDGLIARNISYLGSQEVNKDGPLASPYQWSTGVDPGRAPTIF